MTAWDLFVIAFQRWIVTLVCAVVTALVVFSVMQVKPVYAEQVRVVLLPPELPPTNGLGAASASLVELAGVVARNVQGANPQPLPVSDAVTLFDQGIRSGFSVVQPNIGGQWAYNFQDPILDVQAVDRTPGLVRKKLQSALDEVHASLSKIQDQQGVSSLDRVRTSVTPATPQVTEQKGSRIRAVAGSALAGCLIAAALLIALGPKRSRPAFYVRRLGSSRRAARRPTPSG